MSTYGWHYRHMLTHSILSASLCDMSVLKLNPSVSDPPKSSQGFSAKSYSLHETVTEFCMEILAHQYQ